MWAQLIKMHMLPGRDGDLLSLFDQVREIEQQGSGLLQTLIMHDQKDPTQAYVLVVFESEEHARAREADPARQEAMKSVQAAMGAVFGAPPEFVDLTVLADVRP
jgi:quinol monooxygenase YgiN